ncbi:unnamed protein product [Rhizophagus irregularis]|nr:unnamed protein product [Rhizophagus irregularis]
MPKGKQKQVSPSTKKKRKTVPVSKANNSRSPSKTTKKQPAALSPKTISTVMTGYMPTNKDLVWEIMVYDIPSTWSQLNILNCRSTNESDLVIGKIKSPLPKKVKSVNF